MLILAACTFIFSIFLSQYQSYSHSPKKVQEKISSELLSKEKTFISLTADTSTLFKLINNKSFNPVKQEQIKLPFGFFIYANGSTETKNDLLFWNSNKYSVQKDELKKGDGHYFVNYQNGSFEIIKKTVQLHNKSYILLGVLPIRWHFFIENKYLKTSFDNLKVVHNFYEISANKVGLPIYNIKNEPLFYIQQKKDFLHEGYDWLTIVLRIFSVICIFFYLQKISKSLVTNKGFVTGFIFLLCSILLLRLISYFFPFPFDFKGLPLFDPSIYASNFIHPSLGDLLINNILVFWMAVFYQKNYRKERISKKSIQERKISPYIYLFLQLLITFLGANIIRSLIQDSKISFDVSNFFSLTIYSLIGFIILGICTLNFYKLSSLIFEKIFSFSTGFFSQILFVISAGLLLQFFLFNSINTLADLCILCWLVIFILIVNVIRNKVNFLNSKSSVDIFWILYFSLSVAFLVTSQFHQTEFEQRKKWAEKLIEQADPESEPLLKIATTNFNDDFLSNNFNRLTQEYSNKYIKDSLTNENFSGYLNKYDTRIYFFDSLYKPLFNDDTSSFLLLKTTILNQSKETSIANLYILNSQENKQGYIYEKKITTRNFTQGYLFVTVKPKRYKSEALYPELFRQVQDLSSDFNTSYAFAIYLNGKLINRFNDYNFSTQLDSSLLKGKNIEKRNSNGFTELWYKNNNGKTIIIARKSSFLVDVVTLFAYLFCIFLLLVVFIRASNYIIQLLKKEKKIQHILQLNIRTQIHATIIFISIFSFIIIGAATISFFIFRFNQANQDRLSKSINVMANEMEEQIKIVQSQLEFDDVLSIDDIGFGKNIEAQINRVSEVHNVDVNFYDLKGNLVASTQPYIYNKHLLNEKMDATAFIEMNDNNSIRFIQSEKVANFSYVSIYVPLTNDDNKTYAYLNIPYLNSQAELNQEISGFLATLINLNALIFLLAGAIAYLATERIASSFSLISGKMRDINLGEQNEAIKWNRNDEIGVLVNEYNKMVQKLETSAKALAQSEREGAWREMARQVAHEIKNPLTPMKLSIQYLQKSIQGNNANIKELTNQMTSTLVQQIEQLSKIAGDFSQFANISNIQPEVFEVADVLNSLVQLYSAQERVTLNWQKINGKPFIYADKIQISRLFSNLLLNAIEACEEKERAIITISELIENNCVHITIADNGSGIDEEKLHKIFTPNFTTKTSGTGLGLAICKGIVEKANGTISFKTKKNEGTSFTVAFPLHNNK